VFLCAPATHIILPAGTTRWPKALHTIVGADELTNFREAIVRYLVVVPALPSLPLNFRIRVERRSLSQDHERLV
jgi:hypothetical protein